MRLLPNGSVLALSCQSGENSGHSTSTRYSMDLYCDNAQSLLDVLSHLAVKHIVSCIGNEQEVDRMLLGIYMILSNEFSACVIGVIEPLTGRSKIGW